MRRRVDVLECDSMAALRAIVADPPAMLPERGPWLTPVLRGPPADAGAMDRDDLEALWRGLRTRVDSAGEPARPGVVVVEAADPAAVLGALLAGLTRRALVIDGPAPAAACTTYVGSAARFSYAALRALAARHRRGSPYAIFTAPDLASLSRLVHRSLADAPDAGPELSLWIGAGPAIPMDTVEVVADPSRERVGSLMSARFSVLSFFNHGRDFCGRLGSAALCCMGTEGQDQGRCIDGMRCFDRDWLRVHPATVNARAVLVNSCSVIKPTESRLASRSIGMEMLRGQVAGVISPFQVSLANPLENLFFHALCRAGFTLGEAAALLNLAAQHQRTLVAAGDAALPLGPARELDRATCARDEQGGWMLSLDGDDSGWCLRAIADGELARHIQDGPLHLFVVRDADAPASDEPALGRVMPGLDGDRALFFVRRRPGDRAWIALDPGHPRVRALQERPARIRRAVDDARRFMDTDGDQRLRLAGQIELQVDLIERLLLRVLGPQRWSIVEHAELDRLDALLDSIVAAGNDYLVESIGTEHCIDTVALAGTRVVEEAVDEPCSYCDETIARQMRAATTEGSTFQIDVGVCPRCGLVHYRRTPDLRLQIDAGVMIDAQRARWTVTIDNRAPRAMAATVRLAFFPTLPGRPGLRPAPPAQVLVAGHAATSVDIEVAIEPGCVDNLYIAQVMVAHDLVVDFGLRPVRLPDHRERR